MQIVLQSIAAGQHQARPVIRLALGTLERAFADMDPARAFRNLNGFAILIQTVRLEQLASGVPMESPLEPGPIASRISEKLLTIDVHYNEINMVLDRVTQDDRDDGGIPSSRDYLDTFADQVEAAVARLISWCDEKKAWADRAHFTERWTAGMEKLRAGSLDRPYEFTANRQLRDAMDACWAMAEATPLQAEQFETLSEAYFLLRDVGWQEAEYGTDEEAEATQFGQPALVSNFADNIASSPAPDASHGYLFV